MLKKTPSYYCVIGNPISHSLSPFIHTEFSRLTNQNLIYEAKLIEINSLNKSLKELINKGLNGCNITVPFKIEAIQIANVISDKVKLAQSTNTLIIKDNKIYAENTDGIGLINDIKFNLNYDLKGKKILILGAGGASAGILGNIIEEQPELIVIVNRTLIKAENLINNHLELAKKHQVELNYYNFDYLNKDLNLSFDIIINATSMSLSGEKTNLSNNILNKEKDNKTLVYDLMYGHKTDNFLNWAKENKAQTSDGLGMLVEQAAESFYLWRNIKPETKEILKNLRLKIKNKVN